MKFSSFAVISLIFLANIGYAIGSHATFESFEIYILAQFWPAELCTTESHTQDCENPINYWKSDFTIHGLWPNNQDGSYPSKCDPVPFNQTVVDDIIGFDTMITYWPNLSDDSSESESKYTSFWEHEWSKHGTCSGLSQEEWMTGAIKLAKSFTPRFVKRNIGKTVNKNEFMKAFGANNMIIPLCNGGKSLTGIESCWSAKADGSIGSHVTCSDTIMKHDNCDDAFTIPSF